MKKTLTRFKAILAANQKKFKASPKDVQDWKLLTKLLTEIVDEIEDMRNEKEKK